MAKSPINLIKDGLKNRSWDKVAEGYKGLTGEIIQVPELDDRYSAEDVYRILLGSVTIPPEIIETPAETKKKTSKKTSKKKTTLAYEDPDCDMSIPTKVLVTGEVNMKGQKMKIIGEDLLSDDEIEINKNLLTTRAPRNRSAYTEKFLDCDSCGNEFNFTKAYPVGLATSTSKKYCDKCRNKRD